MLRKNFPGRKYERRVNALERLMSLKTFYQKDCEFHKSNYTDVVKMNVIEFNVHLGTDTVTKSDQDSFLEAELSSINHTATKLALINLTIKNTQAKLGTKDQTHTKKSRVGKGKLAYN